MLQPFSNKWSGLPLLYTWVKFPIIHPDRKQKWHVGIRVVQCWKFSLKSKEIECSIRVFWIYFFLWSTSIFFGYHCKVNTSCSSSFQPFIAFKPSFKEHWYHNQNLDIEHFFRFYTTLLWILVCRTKPGWITHRLPHATKVTKKLISKGRLWKKRSDFWLIRNHEEFFQEGRRPTQQWLLGVRRSQPRFIFVLAWFLNNNL